MEKSILPEMTRILRLEGQAILDCAQRLQSGQMEKALGFFKKSLDQGGKIVVTGIGKSGKIAQKIAATLCSTGSLAVYLHPTEGLHGDLGLIQSKDTVLILSYTGNTEEVMRLLPFLKTLGVQIVGLGGNSQSKLAKESHAWIDAEVSEEACPFNLAPTTSTTLALALGDALAITLMQMRDFNAQAFAKFHPGGSLGKKLNLKVQDLMHTGSSVALVGPMASMEEVVVVSTQKKLGAALVVEGDLLLGIITDGDIRRSLQHREKFFELKAEEVMTRQPITVDPEMMAEAALLVMENRPSQIAVLPVVDSQNRWKGLIRLHDLIQTF